MFYFRINKMRVIDNRTSGFLFLKKDLANVKVISLVTTGNDDIPDLTAWMQEVDPARKRDLLKAAVSSVVASRDLTEVRRVRDNQNLTFGDTGYVLYQSRPIPDDFNWCLLVVKSNRDTNELGRQMAKVIEDPEFDTFAGHVATVAGMAANPVFAAGVEVAKFAVAATARILQNIGDAQIGISYMSFNRTEHYLHGERKKDDVPDITGNLRIDYSLFAFES